jgi:hypothetical protein
MRQMGNGYTRLKESEPETSIEVLVLYKQK